MLDYVTVLSRHVLKLSRDDCTAQQFYLKKEFFQLLNLTTSRPTRVIRNNVGRCLAYVLSKGDRKLLFETVNDLVNIISGKVKGDAEQRVKHAAVHCLGEVYAAAGDSAIGLHPLACSTILKALNNAQSYAGLRAAVFRALGKIVGMIGSSMDDSTMKDIWKKARNYASSDKSFAVQIQACRCLESQMRSAVFFDNFGDFESLKSTIWKAIDSPSPAVRHAAAACLAATMVKHHTENAPPEDDMPRIKALKKTNTKRLSMGPKGGDEEENHDRSETPSPGPRKSYQLAFTVPQMLNVLSTQYVKLSTSNKARAGIAACYGKIMKGLNETTIESQYLKIADHLMTDVLSNSQIAQNRYRLLSTRRFVRVILEDIVGREILGETGQMDAAKKLTNGVLKNYPQVIKEKPEPTKFALIAALSALATLIKTLGSATNGFADACREALLQVLQHPSYTVQIYTSFCLQAFVVACPQQLLPCLTVCMNSLTRELSLLASSRNARRCIGYANGLAAMISTSSLQPLYGSVDVNARVLSMATTILKSSKEMELRTSGTQIQVAWILIGGLMALGPNFVKIHLSQLLLLWKNALPKPLAKDNTTQRSYLELSFLTHVRECALGSILAFLRFNSRLLTVDVSKRIAAMLQNTSAYLKNLPAKKTNDDISQRLTPSLQLQDFDTMLQRRVLQCYTMLVNLSPTGGSESLLQSNLLTLAISCFADPEKYAPSSMSTAIASSAGNFESIWDIADNCGFGVTGLVRGFEVESLPGEHTSSDQDKWPIRGESEAAIDAVLLSPVCPSIEHDSVNLYLTAGNIERAPDPAATEVVNIAIKLFAIALPLTPPKIQESILEQLASFLATGSLQRDPGRKAAMIVNISTALLCTLKVAVKETQSPPGSLASPAVEKLMQEMLREFVMHPDQYVRSVAYEALGRLCNSSGNAFTNQEINYLVDTIVSNREPGARAGCAVALGCIHSQVGGMAAGFHLKTIISILMSLCNDPHPTVHFWALEALSRVAESAGLTFSGYVSGSLGMLGQLYTGGAHNEEVASQKDSNMELDLPTTAVIARCVDSLVNVLGPDLQDMTKNRELILTLIFQFRQEQDPSVLGQSLRCLEHLALYSPGHLNFADYVTLLQADLNASISDLQNIAVDGLSNLMKRNPEDVVKAAGAYFEDQLWLILDAQPTHDGIKTVIRNWVQQSCLVDPARWVQRFQTVFSMTRSRVVEAQLEVVKPSGMDLQDEEVAGFATAAGTEAHGASTAAGASQEPLRWQVRTFAMSCLGEMFMIVSKATISEGTATAQLALQKKVAEIIRVAFSASTSNVVELRVWGLKIIDMVLKTFGKVADPDFPEAPLLEQYQAQISSALTPAFAADSSPELASEAVNVCAAFIATGIVTDVDRMGRILKTLVTALENFSTDSETASIGDLKGLSSNAQVMVRMAVFSAWAELQVASTHQKYLTDVMKPYVATLTPLWLASLREFARLRFEPDISMSLGPPSLSGSLDSIYSAMNRETLLKFYQDSWLNLVDAIASLIEQDSDFVFEALDGKEADEMAVNGRSKSSEINYRDEPVAFFFVLFGIAFEALTARPGSDSLATEEQTLGILSALKKILHPSVSGHAIYREEIFSETMDLLDRLVLTEGLDIQGVIVQIARDLCLAHPSATKPSEDTENGELSDDIEQLFELTRIIVLVLAGLVPNLTEDKQPVRHQLTEEAVTLVRLSLDALVDAAEVFPAIIKTDLHACIIHIFATALATPSCQATVVPQSLPILKRFVASMASSRPSAQAKSGVQLRGCIKRFLSTYIQAQKRETDASLPCVKNSLLACTVVLTSGSNNLAATDPLITRFIEEAVNCLSDRMTSKVASSCIRSILVHTPKTSADQSIIRHLLPRLLTFITATSTDDPENARPLISHALTLYISTLNPSQQGLAMALLIPAFLSRASSEGHTIYVETSTRLLDLAGADQAAFRGVVAGMNEAQKAFLEVVVRAGRQSQVTQRVSSDDGREPTIALMNFGSG